MSDRPQLIPPEMRGFGKPAGKISFAFGRRFYLLLLIGLVWVGPAWSERRFLLAMVLWDIALLLIWSWDLGHLPRPAQIGASRLWTEPPQLGLAGKVTLELQNSGSVGALVQITEDAPASFGAGTPQLEVTVAGGRQTASVQYTVRPGERGDARFGNVYLRYESPLRIAQRWATVPLQQTVRVYPNLQEAQQDTIYLIRSRQIAIEKRHTQQRGQGREFESLREYREGDEWRDICWSATARRGKLISQSHRIERSQTLWLVLDAGRLLRTRVLGLSKLDHAAGAALSLAQVAMYSGDRVAMLAYGRRVQQRLPAGSGSGHVRALLDGLAQVKGEEFEADHQRAAEALLTFQKRRSLVVWLTDLSETAATPEVIESASRLAHRHLVLFTVIGQPEMRELLRRRPGNPREMYHYVAAQEIVHRRDVLLRTLRQQGALTLEVDPTNLSSAIVNQYLSAKERGMV
jgi:uncharacterized protein (DUF58 family)